MEKLSPKAFIINEFYENHYMDEREIKWDQSFYRNSLDDLEIVGLIMDAEKQFSIQISDDDCDKIDTPNQLLNHIEKAIDFKTNS